MLRGEAAQLGHHLLGSWGQFSLKAKGGSAPVGVSLWLLHGAKYSCYSQHREKLPSPDSGKQDSFLE